MTTNVTATERARRRYNRIVYGFFAVGIVAMLLGLQFGYELIGSIVYLLGIVGGVGSSTLLKRRTSAPITDERDQQLTMQTSHLAMRIITAVTLAVFPVLFVLDAAGTFEFTPLLEGVLYTVSAIGLLWGLCYGAVKYVL